MNKRREFLRRGALLGLIATGATRAADAPTPKGRGEIARFALGGDFAGHEAVLVDLVARPATANGGGGAHRHPGFVLGYVLEGAYAFGINGEIPRVIRAGESFFEERGALHSGNASGDPDRPAHLLAFMVVPAGEKLVLPA